MLERYHPGGVWAGVLFACDILVVGVMPVGLFLPPPSPAPDPQRLSLFLGRFVRCLAWIPVWHILFFRALVILAGPSRQQGFWMLLEFLAFGILVVPVNAVTSALWSWLGGGERGRRFAVWMRYIAVGCALTGLYRQAEETGLSPFVAAAFVYLSAVAVEARGIIRGLLAGTAWTGTAALLLPHWGLWYSRPLTPATVLDDAAYLLAAAVGGGLTHHFLAKHTWWQPENS
jgi:hypothetical protein